MKTNPETNRIKTEASRQRRAKAYTFMKRMYLQERNLEKFPRRNRAPDYSRFDEWLAQKLKE